MAIDKTPIHVQVQNLHIVGWIVAEEEQLTKINSSSKKTCNRFKSTLI
jgi:hypothetical protein